MRLLLILGLLAIAAPAHASNIEDRDDIVDYCVQEFEERARMLNCVADQDVCLDRVVALEQSARISEVRLQEKCSARHRPAFCRVELCMILKEKRSRGLN